MPILALVLNPAAPPARQVPRLDFLPEVDRRDVQRIFKSAIASKEPEALEAAWDVLGAIAAQDYPEVLATASTDQPATPEPTVAPQDDRSIAERVLEATDREALEAIAASVGGVDALLPQLPAKARLHYVTYAR